MPRPLLAALLVILALPIASAANPVTITVAPDASALEKLAGLETQRYLYQRTGEHVPISVAAETATDQVAIEIAPSLDPQAYRLLTTEAGGRTVLHIAGGTPIGALYGAYAFAEEMGARFYLHGDVLPDQRIELKLPMLDIEAEPLFEHRGIQPFHDFPEGPDWWDRDDYLAIISQLPKLRMNFIGLHCYPERSWDPELTVWIGLEDWVRPSGDVTAAYPASYANTRRNEWGYAPKETDQYLFGASELFPSSAYGPAEMRGQFPHPDTPRLQAEAFNRTGDMLKDAFSLARELGVTTTVGTETPLTIPADVRERLKARGIDPASDEAIRLVYEGIFTRANRAYNPDYYWLWTPENWTWSGTSDAEIASTARDIGLALDAMSNAGDPMTLGTCGWVLGPPSDRSLFDEMLPPESPMACINRAVGADPVEPAFADVDGRPQWAIPWLEDDPAMTAPQLWVSRMRRDAADALEYGCTGLMGIHWRTRNVAPMVSALAAAGWEQDGWERLTPAPERPEGSCAIGGNEAAFPQEIADTEDDPLYRTVRYNLAGYQLDTGNGSFTVTLKFCEPHYGESGKRVFGVTLEDKVVIESLDIFDTVGKDRAIDYTFEDVNVEDGWLDIGFIRIEEHPSIAAIEVTQPGRSMRINCAGGEYEDYMADLSVAPALPKGPPCGDFYLDWATSLFGPEAASGIARIMESVDGQLPRPATWVGGPGGMQPDPRPSDEALAEYAFVSDLEALAPRIRGVGNAARFEYWLSNMQYLRAMGALRCHWSSLLQALDQGDVTAAEPAYRQLASGLADVYDHLLPTVSSPGELGTIMNWEHHILPSLIEEPERRLVELRDAPLPEEWRPGHEYSGELRLAAQVRPSMVRMGEDVRVEALVLTPAQQAAVRVVYRELGAREWRGVGLRNAGRGCFEGAIPAPPDSIEYYLECTDTDGNRAVWPPTAPELCESVVVWNPKG